MFQIKSILKPKLFYGIQRKDTSHPLPVKVITNVKISSFFSKMVKKFFRAQLKNKISKKLEVRL